MRTKAASDEAVKLDVIRLCHSGLDASTLRIELLKRLRKVIPFEYVYFSTTDPATQLITHSVMMNQPPPWLMSAFIENEFLQDDFNKFSDMFRERQRVAVLSETTHHQLHRSQRYQNMLSPLAMGDELRAIFVSDATCWGTLCLHREWAEAGYTAYEADYLTQLVPHIADGLRKALLLDNISLTTEPNAPGLLLLSDNLSIMATTAAADYWLTELAETERGDPHGLPLSVQSVVAGLKAIERGIVSAEAPRVRLRTRSGQWVALYASRLNKAGEQGQISVIFEAAQPMEIALIIMQAYQLTRREGEITQCVLRGWSTAEIANRLHISPNTVQDHLKAIFGKVDVASRGELAARIFTQHYQPKL